MIDRVKIKEIITKEAQTILSGELSELKMETLVKKCASIAKSEFEEYIFSQEKVVSARIEDGNQKTLFLDFTDGYVSKMKKWIKSNNVEIRKMEFDLNNPHSYEENSFLSKYKNVLLTAGIGTVVVVGLWFFTPTLFALGLEMLLLIIVGKKIYDIKEKENGNKVNEAKSDNLKQQFIQQLVEDLDAWLDKAENESEQIINAFNNN